MKQSVTHEQCTYISPKMKQTT